MKSILRLLPLAAALALAAPAPARAQPLPVLPDTGLTVVLAVFHNAVLGKSVTLAITLWATQEAGQPSRFYSLAEAAQSIAADFSNFGQDPAKLKKKLRAAGAAVHDTFEPYAAAFKRQFGISGNQARLGGGVATVNATFTISSTPVTANTATVNAGGIHRLNGTITLTTSSISGNSSDNCVTSSPAVPGCIN